MSLQNQRRVNVRIDGADTGVWDTKSGGDADSAEQKYSPGGMGEEISLGGKRTVSNVVCSRLFTVNRDLEKVKGWMNRTGVAPVVINELFLDPDKNVVGAGLTYGGTLKRVSSPDHNSMSDDEAMVEIEVTISGPIS